MAGTQIEQLLDTIFLGIIALVLIVGAVRH